MKKFVTESSSLPESYRTTWRQLHIARQTVQFGTAVGCEPDVVLERGEIEGQTAVSKMTTVEEEADETMFCMELLVATVPSRQSRCAAFLDEVEPLSARIVVASVIAVWAEGR